MKGLCSVMTVILAQEFECMSPVIPEEARNAPQHAEWLNGAGSFDLSHVGDLPAELIEDVFSSPPHHCPRCRMRPR
jgi:hypothetical protein